MVNPTTRETVNGAKCYACAYLNDMPIECLRDHWQDLGCGRCATALEYRGIHVDAPWEYEIHTRAKGEAPHG
ncbi:hypothetical protein SAMN06295912_102282 [Sphingomonas laterariae]|uniref:Uncharacterized protein n=1 Tax=Edaphosphingomonas laterariae TaxID=861865 RepID=A0A239CNK7_9SPHN|nr:hypothetical protein [Sphingomonas laterariae]SNS21074.1 hypothetical protein SAMN06295912_102282 [Sphingomonas laterariae]